MRRLLPAATILAVLPFALGAMPAVSAQPMPGICRANQNDHAERPAPDALLPRLGRTFNVAPATLRGGSYVRCADGRLLGCMVGANLNCGRANTSRRSTGADTFCRETPGADDVPMAATGHDTIYDWHCAGTHAIAGRIVAPVDRLGFMSGNWRPVLPTP